MSVLRCDDVAMTAAAIVIVGGAGRRLGGVAKPWVPIGDRPMIDWVVDAAKSHVDEIVLVGTAPSAWVRDDIRWTCEEPPGSGPVAAVAAALATLGPQIEEVLLLAGDTPNLTVPLQLLFDVPIVHDGVAVESEGHVQYLCARLKRPALATALVTAGTSMRSVFANLDVVTVEAELSDADTWEDVARLRQEFHMDDWLQAVAEKLGIDATIDIDAVLDLTRDVAHNQERKNAPLTAYLLGYAVAMKQMQPSDIAAAAAEIGAMAKGGA